MSAPSNYTLSSNIPKRPAKCRKPDESLLEDRGPNLTTAKANQVLLQFVGSKEPINKKEIIEKHNVAQRNLNDCIRFYVNYGVMKSPVKQQVVFEEDFTYDHENMTKLPEIHKQLWHLDAYEKSIDQAYANLSAELEALKKNKWLYLDPEDVHLKDEDVLVSRCEQAEVKIDAQKVLISNAERVAVCKKWSKEELGIPAEGQRFLDKKEYDLKYSSSIQINDKILSPKFRRKLHEVLSKMSVDENKKNLLNIINLFNSNEFDHDNRKSVSEILGDKGLLDFSMIKYLNDFNSQAVQYLNSKDRSQQAFRIRFIEKYLDFLLREMNNGRPNNQFSSGVTMHQNPSPAERDIFTLIEPKLVYPKQKNWEKTHHVIPIDERPNRRTEPRRVQISERQRRRNNQRQREEIAQVPNILLRIHPEQYGQTEQQPQQWMEQQPSFPSPEYETHQGQLLSPVLQESGPVSNTVIPRKRQNHDDEYLQHKKFRQQDYCAPPNDMLCQPATNVSKDDLDFMSEFLVFENRLNPIKEYPIPQNITMENIEENYQNNFENQISYEFHGAHQYQEREYQPQPTSKWDPELQAALLELGV